MLLQDTSATYVVSSQAVRRPLAASKSSGFTETAEHGARAVRLGARMPWPSHHAPCHSPRLLGLGKPVLVGLGPARPRQPSEQQRLCTDGTSDAPEECALDSDVSAPATRRSWRAQTRGSVSRRPVALHHLLQSPKLRGQVPVLDFCSRTPYFGHDGGATMVMWRIHCSSMIRAPSHW